MRKIVNVLKTKGMWGALNCIVLSLVLTGAQMCCFWFYHQPEVPAEADKYRKFK